MNTTTLLYATGTLESNTFYPAHKEVENAFWDNFGGECDVESLIELTSEVPRYREEIKVIESVLTVYQVETIDADTFMEMLEVVSGGGGYCSEVFDELYEIISENCNMVDDGTRGDKLINLVKIWVEKSVA